MRKLIGSIIIIALIIPIVIVVMRGQEISGSLDRLTTTSNQAQQQEDRPTTPVEKPKQEEPVKKEPKPEKVEKPSKPEVSKPKVIVIDPGHQRYADFRLEKIGKGSDEWKPMMQGSTYGIVTGQAEHQLTLDVANKLKKQLIQKGYKVKLTRTENVIAMSTKQRADFAHKNKADLYIQLHADGRSNAQANGMYIVVPSKDNLFTKKIHKESRELANTVINTAKDSKQDVYKKGIVTSANLPALNWSKMPTVLIELGYLNNPKDDRRLATTKYQNQLVENISTGIENYIKK